MKTTVLCSAVLFLVCLVGCAPSISPLIPDITLEQRPPAGIYSRAQKGEPVLTLLYRYSVPVYVPATTVQPSQVMGLTPPLVSPEQAWVAFLRTDRSTYLVEPPPGYMPGKRLSLEITPRGALASDHPWFDLAARRTAEQQPWAVAAAQTFQPQGQIHLDILKSQWVYEGMRDGRAHFTVSHYKHPLSSRPVTTEAVQIGWETRQARVRPHLVFRLVAMDENTVLYQVLPEP